MVTNTVVYKEKQLFKFYLFALKVLKCDIKLYKQFKHIWGINSNILEQIRLNSVKLIVFK